MLLLVGAALCALAGAADLPAPRWRVQRRGLRRLGGERFHAAVRAAASELPGPIAHRTLRVGGERQPGAARARSAALAA